MQPISGQDGQRASDAHSRPAQLSQTGVGIGAITYTAAMDRAGNEAGADGCASLMTTVLQQLHTKMASWSSICGRAILSELLHSGHLYMSSSQVRFPPAAPT